MFDNIRDLIFYICRNENDSDVSKAAVLMWFIWQNQNNYVWNDNKSTAQQVGIASGTILATMGDDKWTAR
jgi:hypothetical protein